MNRLGTAVASILLGSSILFGCAPPSTEDLNKDISSVKEEIVTAQNEFDKYSGGLVKALIAVRLETLNNTLAALEQKRTGINRFIHTNYTIDGKAYVPPQNKLEIIRDIDKDISAQKADLANAENEDQQYVGGLVKVLIKVRITTISNNILALESKKMYLKYDIPNFIGSASEPRRDKATPDFQKTPGNDSDKL